MLAHEKAIERSFPLKFLAGVFLIECKRSQFRRQRLLLTTMMGMSVVPSATILILSPGSTTGFSGESLVIVKPLCHSGIEGKSRNCMGN